MNEYDIMTLLEEFENALLVAHDVCSILYEYFIVGCFGSLWFQFAYVMFLHCIF